MHTHAHTHTLHTHTHTHTLHTYTHAHIDTHTHYAHTRAHLAQLQPLGVHHNVQQRLGAAGVVDHLFGV
jgi:hypothetical protein